MSEDKSKLQLIGEIAQEEIKKMNKEYTIEELLDKLVGHTDIACETNYDNDSKKNLDILYSIGNYVLDKLYDNAKWNNDYRASANCIAKKSIRIAKDYKEIIEGILRYDEILGDKEIKEIPQFKGTLEQLDSLTIRGDDNDNN